MRSSGISIIIVRETRSLSTNGSRSFPNPVTVPYLLAKNPSKMSVTEAKTKNNVARKLPHLPGKERHVNTIGMETNLAKVNVLGRLNKAFLWSVFI